MSRYLILHFYIYIINILYLDLAFKIRFIMKKLKGKIIIDIACGDFHSVALDN